MSDTPNDPFNISGMQEAPANWSGMSPDFWHNLAQFGSQMSMAANARTPQGFLQYGNGFAGPFGAGLSAGMQNSMDVAKQRAQLGLTSAQAYGTMADAQLKQMQIPFMQQRLRMMNNPLFMQYLMGGPSSGGENPGPQSSVTPDPNAVKNYSVAQPPPTAAQAAVVNSAAGKYNVPPEVANWVGYHESSWNRDAVGPQTSTGTAKGPWQFMDATAKQYGLADPTDFASSTDAAMHKLSDLYKQTGNWADAIQAYGTFSTGQGAARDAAARQGFLAYAANNPSINAPRNGPQTAQAGNVATDAVPPVGIPPPAPQGAAQPTQTAQAQPAPQGSGSLWQPQRANAPGQFSAGYISPETAFERAAQARQRAVALQMIGMDATPATQEAQNWQDYGQKQLLQQTQPQTIRGPGSAAISPATGRVLQSPDVYEITGPDGRKYRITQNAVETGEPYVRPSDVPAWAPPGTRSISLAEMSPGEAEAIKEGAQDAFGEKARAQYASAAGTMRAMEDLETQADRLNAGGPSWYNTGAGAQWKLEFGKQVNALAANVGGSPIFDPDKLASGEDMLKQSKLAGMQTLQAFFGGSREAASIVQSTQNAVPNLENSPLGGKLVLNGIKEAARWQMDQHTFMSNWSRDHAGDMRGADVAFTQQYNPAMYTRRAISQVRPYEIPGNDPKELQRFLPGTHFTVKSDPTHAVRAVPGTEDVQLATPPVQPGLGTIQ